MRAESSHRIIVAVRSCKDGYCKYDYVTTLGARRGARAAALNLDGTSAYEDPDTRCNPGADRFERGDARLHRRDAPVRDLRT